MAALFRNPAATLLRGVRRLFPYLVFFVGAVIGSAALLRLLRTEPQYQSHELPWLGVSLLLFWLAVGLLQQNPRSWKLYHGAGAVLTGGMGLACLLALRDDVPHWINTTNASMDHGLPWIVTGVALLVWSVALLANDAGTNLLWQCMAAPAAVTAFWWWQQEANQASRQHLGHLVVFSAVYFAAAMVVLVIIAHHGDIDSEPIGESLPGGRKSWQMPRTFPSSYHELLARGRFCELFEVPCNGTRCPLPTAIVMKYQKRRLQYRQYPEILEPFEKAYAVLVTPQLRELCKVAHEILQAKEKQVGPARYQEMELYLWQTLWDRLQSPEYRGDAQKALQDKARLLKEITPPDED